MNKQLQKQYLIGSSIDIHNTIVSDQKITLGGLSFDKQRIIVAHSDGDIILHAIAESILGALGLGDLGEHFSDTNEINKDISSLVILNYCLKLMKQANYEINNIDLTVVSEDIFFNHIKQVIADNLKDILDCQFINLKATRYENNTNHQITVYATTMLQIKL